MLRLLSFRYLRHRWDRAALVAASIALGVATLVSSRTLNRAVGAASEGTTTPLAGADLYISNGELGVRLAVAGDLRAAKIPGVASAEARLFERAVLPDLGGRGAVLVGADFTADGAEAGKALGAAFVRTLPADLASAALLLTRTPVVVSKALADAAGGPALKLRSGSRVAECVIVGYVDFAPDSPARALGANVVGMAVADAARFAKPGPPAGLGALAGGAALDDGGAKVNRVDVRFAPGADRAAATRAVERVVAGRAEVRTPEAHGQAAQEIVGGIQLGFALCSAGAMVVGLFLVYNALSVTVAERRRDIGILRSLGATRGQVLRLFASGALVLGALGSLLGVPLGVLLARVIIGQFRAELGSLFLNPDVDPGWPTAETVILAALAGVLTALLAGLVPAVQAAGEDPAGAVRRVTGRAGRFWLWLHRALCVLMVGGGVAMMLARHELPARLGSLGGMMLALVGLLLAAPILVHLMIRIVYPLLKALPVPARLAADNLLRSPGRTGVVIGAMGAGVAVMVQTAGVGRSNEEPVIAWIDEVLRADLFVFAGRVLEANSSQNPLDPKLVAELGRLPGVESSAGIRYARPEYNGTVVMLVAVDAAAYAEADERRGGDAIVALRPLRKLPGAGRVALVSENFSRRHGVPEGGTFTLPSPRGPLDFTVAAVVRDYSWNRGTVFLDRSLYAELYSDPYVDVCHLFFAPGDAGAAARDGVLRFLETREEVGLTAIDRAAMRSFLADLIERLYALAYLQQIVVGLVASLGVVTALLISVLQRRRELGLLLAVGATPRQVVRSVLAEALLMGVFGTALGVLIGVPLEWYVLRVVILEESGFDFPVLFPWKAAAVIAAGSLGVAMLAGLLPARLAVRTRIPEAVAAE